MALPITFVNVSSKTVLNNSKQELVQQFEILQQMENKLNRE